jgi:hypothetical protein
MSDETVDTDKIIDFIKYQKSKKKPKIKKPYVQTQEEADDIISRSKILSKKDRLQFELVAALAEHVHYLSILIENKALKEKLNSKI